MPRKKYEETTESTISKLRCWQYVVSVGNLKLKLKNKAILPKTHQKYSEMKAQRS